ncbi:MAG: DUF2953 domain-containing protein [Clostridiales bacterium]|nr:DUF2953 domain-containing protein [Clostridiales bacterium]
MLKIAGIVFLALILLVLALLLAVLFVPIRYHLSVAFTEGKKSGEAHVSWLLHLISVSAFVEVPAAPGREETADENEGSDDVENPLSGLSNLQTGVRVRILGMDPAAIRAYFRKRKRKKKEQKRAKRKRSDQTGNVGQTENNRKRECASQTGKSGRAERSRLTEQAGRTKEITQMAQTVETGQSQQTKQTIETGPSQQTKQTVEAGPPRQIKQSDQTGSAARNTFFYKLRAFCDKIKQVPDRIRRLLRKGKKLLRKPEQIKRKLCRFFRKIEKYEAREVLLEVWEQVKRMLRHFRVRKGTGYFRFGTGDPALTGELTGVLYLLLPASCGDLQIEPQFTEPMLETELEIRGYIRLIHLVHLAWWAFFNKKLRRLIRAFRK